MREGDEHNFEGFSLLEIIVAFQTFHTSKVMAVPWLISKDRGIKMVENLLYVP